MSSATTIPIQSPSTSTILCSLSLPLLLLFILLWTKTRNKNLNLPPGPTGLPLIGNLHQLGPLPHRSLAALSRRYGPLMYLRLGSIPTLVISSADAARDAFKSHDRAFSGRPTPYAAKRLTYGCSDVSFGPYGDSWRTLRKIMITELLNPRQVQSFESVRAEEVQRMLDTVAASANRSSPVNINELALLVANDIVCRVTFGKRCKDEGGRKSEFQETIIEIQRALGGFCVGDLFPSMGWFNKVNGFEAKVNKCFRDVDRLYDETIAEHKEPTRGRRGTEDEDVVDVLLRLQGDPSQQITLTNENIKGVMTVRLSFVSSH